MARCLFVRGVRDVADSPFVIDPISCNAKVVTAF